MFFHTSMKHNQKIYTFSSLSKLCLCVCDTKLTQCYWHLCISIFIELVPTDLMHIHSNALGCSFSVDITFFYALFCLLHLNIIYIFSDSDETIFLYHFQIPLYIYVLSKYINIYFHIIIRETETGREKEFNN